MSTPSPVRAWSLSSWSVIVLAALSADCGSCARQPAKNTLTTEGSSCALDDECETGLCDVVPGTSDRICLRKCPSGCKDVDQCTLLAAERYGCVPQRAGLCQSCQTDSDCPYPADKCITLGAEKFCGRDCSFDDACPSTFRCADAQDVNGNTVTKQCQPTSGTCACTAVTSGQTMPCEVTNSFGTCLGSQTCTPPAGWAACTAKTPTTELCNGRDDDCDGLTDEDIPDTTCGVGACERRVPACTNGQPTACTPGMPDLEVCNRLDDNCDGRVDENFDLQNDVGNCGTCGRACAFTNAVPKCDMGSCAIDRCIAGWVDLDGVSANGCEHPCTPSNNGVEICDGRDNNCDGRTDEGFDLVGDPMNCGQCGLVCNVSNGSVSSYRCVASRCAVGTCAMGRGDCNQVFSDGCEENLVSSLTHCGMCGQACTPANATGVCQMGNCRIQVCNVGYRDCNLMAGDGCEIDSNNDVNNCGVCGRVCSAANATSACTGGACTFTCLANWYDADNNAANGCEYACVRTNNGVEACDGIDNDCDNRIDEDFNLMTDPAHCGMCNRACLPTPFAMSTTCGGGTCAITACVAGRGDCNSSYADGCEVDTTSTVTNCGGCGLTCTAPNVQTYACVASSCRIQQCNPGRGDCNNNYMDGCEMNTDTSVSNCGGCGNVCTIANGTPGCAMGQCRVNTCNPGFRDCNLSATDGCETNITNDASNCGGCGTVCSRPFTNATCSNSTCSYVCQPGRVDLDGNPANGCEYGCTAMGSDMPDLGFGDGDCDGIDGNASAAIFVAKTGNDANPGTRASPKLTITAGIAQASLNGLRQVYVSAGTYVETITLVNGISLYGGYDVAANWARATTNTTIISSTSPTAVTGTGLNQAIELQLLTIRSGNAVGQEANGDGRSSVAVLAVNLTNLTLNGCTLQPGNGTVGLGGSVGATGTAGQPGGSGVGATQGGGGTSSCGAPGGPGGPGIAGETNGIGGTGGTTAPGGAPGANPGTGGDRGGCSTFSASNGHDAPPVTANGTPGSAGQNANPGASLGTLAASGLYLPPAGLLGGTGQTGGGGGGGGSGGGTQRGSGFLCSGCSNLTSGGGGGGGGGGCGGTGGTGGRGGGGSFGVVSYNSVVAVLQSNITTGFGGTGGTGGAGGGQGSGGPASGGGGGQTYSGSCSDRRAGNGAGGSAGGPGGRGGGGSGGSGGPSVCVFYRGSVPALSGGSCVTRTPASGGLGGSNGVSNASTGASGISSNLVAAP